MFCSRLQHINRTYHVIHFGGKQSKYVGIDTCLGFLPPLGNPMLFQVKVQWEVLGNHWSGMVSRQLHKCCTVRVRVPKVAQLILLGKKGEQKNQMLEQPVDTRSCASIQFFLRNFYGEHKSFLTINPSEKKLSFKYAQKVLQCCNKVLIQ